MLALLMSMDCILEGHWEDRDNNEDLEEEHNHHCELESSTSFPYDPLLTVYAWNSANNSDDVDYQSVFQVNALEDQHCERRSSSSEHGEVHSGCGGHCSTEVKLYKDWLEGYTWAKSNCGGEESGSESDYDKLQCVSVGELDFTLNEFVPGSFLSSVVNLHHPPSGKGQ